MTVIINYKRFNEDDSYEIKTFIDKYCDGVMTRGGTELIVAQGSDTVKFENVVQFTIIND